MIFDIKPLILTPLFSTLLSNSTRIVEIIQVSQNQYGLAKSNNTNGKWGLFANAENTGIMIGL